MTKNASRAPLPWHGETHQGLVRTKNDDFFLPRPDLGLWIVCDGMGGHENGGKAAKICALATAEAFAENPSLTQALHAGHRAVNAMKYSGTHRAPGTTIVALHVDDTDWHLAWAGDSRAWLIGPKDCRQLSIDHTRTERLVAWGEITPKEAKTHPMRGRLTNAVTKDMEMFVGRENGHLPNDPCFILATDGLSLRDDSQTLGRVVRQARSLEGSVRSLIQQSLDDGGADNVTVVQIGRPAHPNGQLSALGRLIRRKP